MLLCLSALLFTEHLRLSKPRSSEPQIMIFIDTSLCESILLCMQIVLFPSSELLTYLNTSLPKRVRISEEHSIQLSSVWEGSRHLTEHRVGARLYYIREEFRCYEVKIEENEKGRQPHGSWTGLSHQCSATELRWLLVTAGLFHFPLFSPHNKEESKQKGKMFCVLYSVVTRSGLYLTPKPNKNAVC